MATQSIMEHIPEKCTHVDFILGYPIGTETHERFDTNVSQERFDSEYDIALRNRRDPTTFESKCLVIDHMIYENFGNKAINVYENHILRLDDCGTNLTAFRFEKKITPQSFPSTDRVNDIYYKKIESFRLHQRVFLNFVRKYYPSDKVTVLQIVLTYNHHVQCDMEVVKALISKTIGHFATPKK